MFFRHDSQSQRIRKGVGTQRYGQPLGLRCAALRWACLLALLLSFAACQERGLSPDDLPTPITDLEALATHQVMTRNAPPPFFRDGVRLPRIDQATDALPGWRAEVHLQFDGVFAGTSRQTSAATDAEIWFSQAGNQRRVVLDVRGELLTSAPGGAQRAEGVRVGDDLFIVQDGGCTPVTTETSAALIADLSAGDMIGGVREAVPDGQRATINRAEVWRYNFLQDALALRGIVPREGGRVTLLGGELWFAPAHNAAIRFYLTLDVENVSVFGSQLPVTGQVVMRYDLYDIGVDPNITVPFGC